MPTEPARHPLWPLFDLRLRTEHLVLRLPTDDDLVALAAVARAGIHEPGWMPFAVAWSTLPSPAFERSFVQHHWEARATWGPDRWWLHLLTELDGRPIGGQSIGATGWSVFRTVGTGSWLGRDHQGHGYGKEMRSAVLSLAFDHLGAEVAETEAATDNLASARVSEALGYRPNGIGRMAPEGVPRQTRRFRMTREDWLGRPRPPIEVEGLERARGLFGLSGGSEA